MFIKNKISFEFNTCQFFNQLCNFWKKNSTIFFNNVCFRCDIYPDSGEHHPAEEPQTLQAGQEHSPKRTPTCLLKMFSDSWRHALFLKHIQFVNKLSGNTIIQRIIFFVQLHWQKLGRYRNMTVSSAVDPKLFFSGSDFSGNLWSGSDSGSYLHNFSVRRQKKNCKTKF